MEAGLPAIGLPSVKIEVGAKAEIKTEIPSSSSGKLLDAITDIIRPLSERRGLKADMLRLQREEVLLEIATRARRRLVVENAPIESIPNKFLIPFLEKSSLEDAADETMIQMWADLLASAATSSHARNNRFISIMEEMNGRQALLLRNAITRETEPHSVTLGEIHDHMYYVNQQGIKSQLEDMGESDDAEEFSQSIWNLLHCPGIVVDMIQITRLDDNQAWDVNPDDNGFRNNIKQTELDYEILESLFLLKKIEIKNLNLMKYGVDAHYYIVTLLGLELFAACNPGWFAPGKAAEAAAKSAS